MRSAKIYAAYSVGEDRCRAKIASCKTPTAHCEAVVRAADKDRFLAALFAPAERRRHLYALYAFNGEIARVRELAREALPGEIRLQWWRDVLAGEARGEVSANPVAAALLDTVASLRPPARSAHPPDRCPRFRSLRRRHGDARRSRRLWPRHRRRADEPRRARPRRRRGGGRCRERRHRLRGDASPAQLSRPTWRGVRCSCRWSFSIATASPVQRSRRARTRRSCGRRSPIMRAHAAGAFAAFRRAATEIPERCAPAFLAAAVVPAWLAKLDRAADPFGAVELPQWRRQWIIWRAARRWPRL